jgi:negative regulator of flagellin synthesis FlgM
MKIENGTMSSITQMEAQLKKTAAQPVTEPAQQVKSSDEAFSVAISLKAEQLSKPQNQDEISHDRVTAIREQLASGTYNISGKDVANKILGVLKP